jgi:YD repeat-containing protein
LLKSWSGKQTDEERNATIYGYDAQYRLTSAVGPKGERTEWSYDLTWQNVSEVRSLAEDGTRSE